VVADNQSGQHTRRVTDWFQSCSMSEGQRQVRAAQSRHDRSVAEGLLLRGDADNYERSFAARGATLMSEGTSARSRAKEPVVGQGYGRFANGAMMELCP
jgi:hypothetical protein